MASDDQPAARVGLLLETGFLMLALVLGTKALFRWYPVIVDVEANQVLEVESVPMIRGDPLWETDLNEEYLCRVGMRGELRRVRVEERFGLHPDWREFPRVGFLSFAAATALLARRRRSGSAATDASGTPA